MSKLMLAFLLFVSAAVYDPPLVVGWAGPQAVSLGWKLRSMLDINRLIPKLAQAGRD
jgi:hypothetical protein